ncbi:MAG: glycosyl hydrolase, partial [Schleiferiaceae bacterium]|nr:glycosyl hydrolase [Schleiferiaceae bacterium]
MAIDTKTGYLYVVFYDRRAYNNLETDVYIAYSKDAGQTWVNEKISESSFTPTNTVFFGDYNNISAYDGVVRPIWTRYEKGKLSVWTALIQMN